MYSLYIFVTVQWYQNNTKGNVTHRHCTQFWLGFANQKIFVDRMGLLHQIAILGNSL